MVAVANPHRRSMGPVVKLLTRRLVVWRCPKCGHTTEQPGRTKAVIRRCLVTRQLESYVREENGDV